MASAQPSDGTSQARLLTTRKIVFLVVAAAAPMAAMVGNVPLALLRGNGIGLPSAFVVASVVLVCFAVGYATMSKRVLNSGAFYTYVARGLGKPTGIATAYVALVGYAALAMGLAASFGYFTDLVMQSEGIDLPWGLYTAVAVGIVALLGYRSADLAAKVLGVLMVSEFAVLIVLDLGILGDSSSRALPAAGVRADLRVLRLARHRADVRLLQLRRLRVRGPVRRGGQGPGAQHPARAVHLAWRRSRRSTS